MTGPFPGFPVPLEGREEDDVTDLIERHRAELPVSDQLPTTTVLSGVSRELRAFAAAP